MLARSLSKTILRSTKAFSTKPEVFAGAFLDKNEVQGRVLNLLKSVPSTPENVNASSYFVGDLGYDNGIRKEVVDKLAEEFCVPVPKDVADQLISVKAAVDFFSTHPKAR